MFLSKGERFSLFLLVLATLANPGTAESPATNKEAKRPFTINDEIGLTHFLEIRGTSAGVSFSPDENYFAVWSERGRVDLNRVEDSLRFYRTRDVKNFLERPEDAEPPAPLWAVSRLGETGPAIDQWRWLPDSSGMVFLERRDEKHRQLMLADVRTKSLHSLTPATESVNAFDVQDRQHYTYSSAAISSATFSSATAAPVKKQPDKPEAAIVGTGHSLEELLLAPPSQPQQVHEWKVAGGKRFEIKEEDAAKAAGAKSKEQGKAGHNGAEHDGLEVMVKQGLNDPPVLVAKNAAKNSEAARVLWDPNPQLKTMDLGQVSVYAWKDKDGKERKGGLYKPSDYRAGQRYPLVIQTHDFNESRFSPAGSILTSTYAGRAMAAAGMVVLQIAEDCPAGTTEDGPCGVSAYESAAKQLVADGVADEQRVGLVAFSWPSFYVMEFLTTSSFPIKAALIANGRFMADYFQYTASAGGDGANPFLETTNGVMGAAPFGDGLQQWLKNSPSFHLERVTAPLLMVAQGRLDVLLMWGPYAGLRYQHKPVDLMEIESSEHVLTNPRARVLSQGGTVDWFRFWLQGYEDADPAKAEQYKRWRALKKMQEERAK